MSERDYKRILRLRRGRQQDRDRELELHLEMRAREFEDAGHTPVEARQLAQQCFGDRAEVERRLEMESRVFRAKRGITAPLEEIVRDLRHGLRSLRRDPGFSVVAILTLGIAVAVSGAVFTVADNVLLRPLNYHDPDRLVTVWSTTPVSTINTSISYPDYADWREQSHNFESLAFLRGVDFTLESNAAPEQYIAALVSPSFVAVLGARAELGSLEALSRESASEPVVVMKHSVWRARFGADPGIIGTTLTFSGSGYIVAAVLEPGVDYPTWADFYVQLTPELIRNEGLDSREYRVDNRVIGRLAPEVTIEAARTELQLVTERLALSYPETNEGWGAAVVSLSEQTVGEVRQSLLVLLASVGVVLLIACGNLANLSLARAVARSREFGVRAAMGASGIRIARQMMTESLVLAVAGTTLGVVSGNLVLSIFIRRGIPGLPRLDEITMDARVLGAAAAVAVATSVVFGLVPAIVASRTRLISSVRGSTSTRGVGLFRNSLVVIQVALAMVLMIGATLLLASFNRLRSQDPGFETGDLVTLRVRPAEEFTGRPVERYELYRRLVADAAARPAVARATIVSHLPLSGTGVVTPVLVPGRDTPASAWLRPAGPDFFFEVLGIPIVLERALTSLDHQGRLPSFVVSAAFARSHFPDTDPLGVTLTIWRQAPSDPGYGEPIVGQIVGVAGDVMRVITEQADEPVVYLPLALNTWTSSYLVVDPVPGAVGVGEDLRRSVQSVDARIPVADVRAVSSLVESFTGRERFLASFGFTFSAVATLLALVGVYGVLAYSARQRSREIGVQIALGAAPGLVARTFLRRGLALVLVGLVLGTGAALGVTRLLNAVLFETSPTDPETFVGVAITLLFLGGLAGWIPARRASRTDPNLVLREE